MEFLFDVRAFARAVQHEFEVSFFDGFDERRKEFNALLERAKYWGVGTDLVAIGPVSAEHNRWSAGVSAEKRSKLREVANAAERLLGRADIRWETAGDPSAEDVFLIAYTTIEQICNRFHRVARQVRDRHDQRSTLDVSDEYDVQDLFHALLKLFFDDIRAEEVTPSYAGGTARTDFLLKDEKIAIEVKKTRTSLTTKQLGEQLLVDIARYSEHPDCQMLVCFVYDPDGRIGNPRGLESDLERRNTDGLRVRVLVRPN